MVNSRAAKIVEKGKLINLIIEVDVQHEYASKQKMAFVSKSYFHILHSMVYNEHEIYRDNLLGIVPI